MSDGEERQESNAVDIEEIMRDVRAEILSKLSPQLKGSTIVNGVGGRRFPPDYYDRLYQAALAHDVTDLELKITGSTIPLLGSLIQRFRRKLHRLVLFYVMGMAVEQAEFNRNIIEALSILTRELEMSPRFKQDDNHGST